MHYFSFIDETGTREQERFFGIGLLMIPKTNEIYEKLKPIATQIRSQAIIQKRSRVERLFREKSFGELALLAKAGKTFELKYDRISMTNQALFCELVKQYFNVSGVKFTAVVVDKQNPNFKPTKLFPGTWDAYITYSAMALAREVSNISPTSTTVLADEISKPSYIQTTFEKELTKKFNHFCTRRNIKNPCQLYCTTLESNAHLLIQIADILLGCVVFDYKYQNGMVSQGLISRRLNVVAEIKKYLKRKDLTGCFTCRQPNYFSVWEIDWK